MMEKFHWGERVIIAEGIHAGIEASIAGVRGEGAARQYLVSIAGHRATWFDGDQLSPVPEAVDERDAEIARLKETLSHIYAQARMIIDTVPVGTVERGTPYELAMLALGGIALDAGSVVTGKNMWAEALAKVTKQLPNAHISLFSNGTNTKHIAVLSSMPFQEVVRALIPVGSNHPDSFDEMRLFIDRAVAAYPGEVIAFDCVDMLTMVFNDSSDLFSS